VSGLDVIRFARNLRADIPAIIITGYADTSSIVDKPLDVPLLTKPFSIDDLERLIGSMIPDDR
jgi:ActR/RegA family two-component response regulator